MTRYFKVILLGLFIVLGTSVFAHGDDPECCHCDLEPVLSKTEKPYYNQLLFELQTFWVKQSLYKAIPNGLFDENMEKAVMNFQHIHHLKVNGRLDADTWRAIGAAMEVKTVLHKLPPGRAEVMVDVDALILTIYVNRRPFRSFPVAIGKIDTPSPIGSWRVVNKGYWVKGKTYWLGLSVPYGVYGIHGTNQPWSIGRRASKGCIRMYNHHLGQVYQWIKPGTPVYIIGNPFRDHRVLKRGFIGADVYYLQIRLKQLGYYRGKSHGFFDYWTEEALKKCQQELNLPVTGEFTPKEYYRLKLYPTD